VWILVRIWNALSFFISCNWQVLLAYLLLIYFFEFTLENEKINYCFCLTMYYSIWHIVFNILYIIYWIQIQCITLSSNTTPMYYSNIMMSRLLEPIFHVYILYSPLPWQWLLDNNPSSFLQACPFKHLVKHERVKSFISLNKNVLKITNDVLWWILS
jgi:hypothetical protein